MTISDDVIPNDGEEDDPEFRYLSSDCGIQPSKRNNYGIPKDVIDMFRSSNGKQNESGLNTLDDVINNRLENVCIVGAYCTKFPRIDCEIQRNNLIHICISMFSK